MLNIKLMTVERSAQSWWLRPLHPYLPSSVNIEYPICLQPIKRFVIASDFKGSEKYLPDEIETRIGVFPRVTYMCPVISEHTLIGEHSILNLTKYCNFIDEAYMKDPEKRAAAIYLANCQEIIKVKDLKKYGLDSRDFLAAARLAHIKKMIPELHDNILNFTDLLEDISDDAMDNDKSLIALVDDIDKVVATSCLRIWKKEKGTTVTMKDFQERFGLPKNRVEALFTSATLRKILKEVGAHKFLILL